MPESVDEGLMQLSNTLSGRIILVDLNCRVLKDSYNLDEGKTIVSSEVVTCLRQSQAGLTQSKDGYISYSSPIFDASQAHVKGALVVLGSTDADMVRADMIAGRIMVMEIVAVGLILVLGLILSRRVVKPFNEVSESISKISEGYIGEKMSVKGYTEIEKLSDSMNTLVGKMQTLDNSRQEFVSNVSHELRTPITSMKVLADSLLDQEDVPVELYK
ncbi:MAG: two-component sensor histidine kinase, partial [Lachnospiraceae bacterium]|nr:two-component sensor histidine kinase [Lachnospiraceae bacterium]